MYGAPGHRLVGPREPPICSLKEILGTLTRSCVEDFIEILPKERHPRHVSRSPGTTTRSKIW